MDEFLIPIEPSLGRITESQSRMVEWTMAEDGATTPF